MIERLNLQAQVASNLQNINVEIDPLLQDIQVGVSSLLIHAFSPTAKVEKLPNGNYLITITDKNGTTTAQVPVVNQDTIDRYITYYFEHNPIIIQQLVKQAHDYQELYRQLKQLIQGAIDVSVPAQPDGSININGTNYQVYELPDQVVTTDDFLIIDCLHSDTEISGDSEDYIPEQSESKLGNGIDTVEFNDDYTLTITFTDGSTYTTPAIRGAKGDSGTGIASTVLNDDYTLTITFTDGTSYTTPSIRGIQGQRGEGGLSILLSNVAAVYPTDADGVPPRNYSFYTIVTARKGTEDAEIRQVEGTSVLMRYTEGGHTYYKEIHPTITSNIGGKQWTVRYAFDKDPYGFGSGSVFASLIITIDNKQYSRNVYFLLQKQGEKGDKGDVGITPDFTIGTVQTLPAGSQATASITGTDEEPVLNLGIPQGEKGEGTVNDVQINGNSILDALGNANIPYAGTNTRGVVSVNVTGTHGIMTWDSNNPLLMIKTATTQQTKGGSNYYHPLTPSVENSASFYGLAKAAGDTTQSTSSNSVGQYTDEAKIAIQKMLGVYRKWELIAEYTVGQDSVQVNVTQDINGQSFTLSEMLVRVWLQPATTGTDSYVSAKGLVNLENGASVSVTFPTKRYMAGGANTFMEYKAQIICGVSYALGSSSSGPSSTCSVEKNNGEYANIKEYRGFRIERYSTDSSLIPVGTIIKIYGIRT